jgi:hypothetical protein
MPQPWDVPAVPSHGDAHEDTISIAVGRALTSWEHIEEALADIFAIFVNADMADPEKAPALRAYGAVSSARGRGDLLQAAAEAYFYHKPDEKLEGDFKEVLRRYRGYSGRRNDVAHGRIGQDSENPANGWYLFPGLYNSNKYPIGQPPSYIYGSAEINTFKDGFESLYDDVVALAASL